VPGKGIGDPGEQVPRALGSCPMYVDKLRWTSVLLVAILLVAILLIARLIARLARLEHERTHEGGLPAPTFANHQAVETVVQRGANPTHLLDAIDEELAVGPGVQQRPAAQCHVVNNTFSK